MIHIQQCHQMDTIVALHETVICETACDCNSLFLGGLTAVIWTDFAQTAIMLVGATVLCALSKFVIV